MNTQKAKHNILGTSHRKGPSKDTNEEIQRAMDRQFETSNRLSDLANEAIRRMDRANQIASDRMEYISRLTDRF